MDHRRVHLSGELAHSHGVRLSADVLSDSTDSPAIEEVPKTLGISEEFLRWRTTRTAPLRLWTPPVSRVPVGTGQRSDEDSPKAWK